MIIQIFGHFLGFEHCAYCRQHALSRVLLAAAFSAE